MGSADCSVQRKYSEQGTWGGTQNKGDPKIHKGKMLEVETARGKPAGTQAKSALGTRPDPPVSHAHPPRPRVYLPWKMRQHFGGGMWFDFLFFLFSLIHLSPVKTRKETRSGQEERRETSERRCPRRLTPPNPPLPPGRALQLQGILALPLSLPFSPPYRKTLMVAR